MLLVIYCIINEVELSYAMSAGAGRKSMILSQHTLHTSVCYCALKKLNILNILNIVSKYTWIVFSEQMWCFEQNARCYFCWASLIAEKLKLFAWANIISGWLFMFTNVIGVSCISDFFWITFLWSDHTNINVIHLINNVLAKVWKLRIYERKLIVWV